MPFRVVNKSPSYAYKKAVILSGVTKVSIPDMIIASGQYAKYFITNGK